MGVPRLLYVVNDLRFFESHRLRLALAARAAGHRVYVAAPGSPLADEMAELGLTMRRIRLRRKSVNPWTELVSLYSIWRVVREVRPDIVHTITIKPTIYAGLAARLAGTRCVASTITGLGYVFIGRSAFVRALRRAVTVAYRVAFRGRNIRVIFQNPDDLALFVKQGIVDPANTVLIKGSGVDTDEYFPQAEPPPPITVVLPARLLWDKGVGEFAAAAEILRGQAMAARFVLVGEPDPGNRASVPLEQLRRWAEAGTLEWWGFREDMPHVLAQAHIVCLPSYREGIPRVLIEAASCARPIVTTDAPGCREIVRDGENGLLVPPRDPAALARALARLIADPALRQRLGRRGREIVEQEFALPIVIRQTLAVYDDLLKAVRERLN